MHVFPLFLFGTVDEISKFMLMTTTTEPLQQSFLCNINLCLSVLFFEFALYFVTGNTTKYRSQLTTIQQVNMTV